MLFQCNFTSIKDYYVNSNLFLFFRKVIKFFLKIYFSLTVRPTLFFSSMLQETKCLFCLASPSSSIGCCVRRCADQAVKSFLQDACIEITCNCLVYDLTKFFYFTMSALNDQLYINKWKPYSGPVCPINIDSNSEPLGYQHSWAYRVMIKFEFHLNIMNIMHENCLSDRIHQ